MANITGTDNNDKLTGTRGTDQIQGEGGSDNISGGNGSDTIRGGGGDDQLFGNNGHDIISGGDAIIGKVALDTLKVSEAYEGKVTFLSESAGYKNILGVYRIADDGTIYDVEILFENASLRGSGGDLIGGESSVGFDFEAGDELGFFIVANGYSQSGVPALLDQDGANFKMIDADGNIANANGDGPVRLVHVSSDGEETAISADNGRNLFHSRQNLNQDGLNHVVAEVNTADGTLRVGFEDLWNGGDNDFDDSVFLVQVGQTNSRLIDRGDSGSGNDDGADFISGGNGNDQLMGMANNDVVEGGNGHDKLWGNSGNDALDGGTGNDELRGGKGDDLILGKDGNDTILGNSGDDRISGGNGDDNIKGESGNDLISDDAGNDVVDGGSGNDEVIAGQGGRDTYVGGSGQDTLDYSQSGANGLTIDLSKGTVQGSGQNDSINSFETVIASNGNDSIKGSKNDDTIEGRDGNDVIRGYKGADELTGGEGEDTYKWERKDLDGVDTITDFNSEDDVLDFSGLVKATNFEDVSEVVRLEQTAAGARVSVYSGSQLGWQDVVVLADRDLDLQTLQDDGALIV